MANLLDRLRSRGALALLGYALVYCVAYAWLADRAASAAGEALGVLIVFGGGFTLLAWSATRGCAPRVVEVRAPRAESLLVLGYLALFAVGFLGVGLSAVRAAFPDEPLQNGAILLAKLAAMVVLPLWLFRLRGYRWRTLLDLAPGDRREWRALLVLCLALGVFQLVVGRGPQMLAEVGAAPWQVALVAPLTFAWLTLEAGLTEEFLFRVLLQTRLAAWLRSETAAIVVMALLFGLAHAPGYVLRGGYAFEGMAGPPDPLTAATYSIVVVSVIGFMFGVLWARTRSLWLVVLVHGFTDTIPHLAEFVKLAFPR